MTEQLAKKFSFFTVFDCSTGHMTKQDDDKLKDKICTISLYDYEYGCFVHVGDEVVEDAVQAGFSAAFINLLQIAKKAGCRFICLDGDGMKYEALPMFEW